MALQVVFGAALVFVGLNTRLQWAWMRRKGRFRLDASGEPMNYGRLVRISWVLVLLGLITAAIGFAR